MYLLEAGFTTVYSANNTVINSIVLSILMDLRSAFIGFEEPTVITGSPKLPLFSAQSLHWLQ